MAQVMLKAGSIAGLRGVWIHMVEGIIPQKLLLVYGLHIGMYWRRNDIKQPPRLPVFHGRYHYFCFFGYQRSSYRHLAFVDL